MNIEKKFFGNPQNGGGDFDSAFFSVGPNNWINMENCRTLTTDAGEVNTVESLGANVLKTNFLLPAGTNLYNGGAIDESGNRFVYFVWNSGGEHSIYAYYVNTGATYLLLTSSQVTGGLNLNKEYFIHSARIINGCVYWVNDELNEPRKLNIDSALGMNLSVSSGRTISGSDRIFKFAPPLVPINSSFILSHVISFTTTVVDNVPMDWSTYDAVGLYQLIINSISAYFTSQSISASSYTLGILPNGSISLTLHLGFAWPSGGVTSSTTLVSFQFIPPNTIPYVAPVSQSVLAWIRRQPGLPPSAVKVFQTSPVLVNNFVALEAFLFCYRYQYRQGELSTLSSRSTLVNYNAPSDTFNRIDVSLPLQEKIDQDVQLIDLVAYYFNGNQAFIIQTWDKSIPSDATAISNHNAGTAALLYNFYNDKTGIAIDPLYFDKPFDSLPVYGRTCEFAKNRGHIGNTTIGYTAPLSTSLTAVPDVQPNSTTLTGEWFFLKFQSVCGATTTVYSNYWIYISNIPTSFNPGYYSDSLAALGPLPPFPATSDWNFDAFAGATIVDVMNLFSPGCVNTVLEYTDQGASSTVINGPAPATLTGKRAFKSDSIPQLTTTFYDYAGRKCGIVNQPIKVPLADRTYADVNFTIGIKWALSNSNALNEIPAFASYYSVDITKCLRTRFFLQMRGKDASYATKDTDGNYVTGTQHLYSIILPGCAFDITSLNAYQMGYLFDAGSNDIVKIYLNDGNPPHFLKILGQVGNWIITELANLGTLDSTTQYLFEIYTPYQPSTTEPYYEVAQLFPVNNPSTSSRTYSSISGEIFGDITLVQRNDGTNNYLVEAMSPNDKFYTFWNTDAGRPNFTDKIGQVNHKDRGSFSNTFIQDSQNNGLSTFDPFDTYDLFPECGPLRKLQLTSKVEGEQGSIMLAICEKETVSLYLSESQLLAANANANVAISDSVIGTKNVLKGSFGTIHPESVCEFRGNVFFLSAINGKYVQYSSAGLFPISNYKMTRFWKLFCQKFLSMSTADVEALGGRPLVFSCVDPHNWEVLVSVPRILSAPPKGYLPDYPGMIYPFDIYDGQAKTLVYKLNAEPNHWAGSYPFSPEGTLAIQNKVFSFKNAQGYEHNSQVFPATYYGVPIKARIMFTANQVPNRPKVYNNMSVEGNLRPSLTYFRTEPSFQEFEQYDLEEQASDLMDFDFEMKEGNLYAAIYRNKIQPTAEGFNLNGLLTGNKMRALTLLVLVEFNPQKGPLELRFINLGYQVSGGHTT